MSLLTPLRALATATLELVGVERRCRRGPFAAYCVELPHQVVGKLAGAEIGSTGQRLGQLRASGQQQAEPRACEARDSRYRGLPDSGSIEISHTQLLARLFRCS